MSKVEEAIRLRAIIEGAVSAGVSDDQAYDAMLLFPSWNPNSVDYTINSRVKYEGKLYKCVQGHQSQSAWTPTIATSLWVIMDNPDEEYPAWRQPTGAHDAYEVGYKVTHNGKQWINEINANVYEPGVYGWSEVTDEVQ